ncbi:hypothetical protein QJS04_geneDACA022332 [Acorus gramineus]|uniref:Secreted protein n=1 Tax=Acorus gramineus TaxID=55184 RepID=A0AAV9AGC6_ACOGR|nr:hypothetical protein QJS04_geneDACA022332 [Acorus gramineus]
MKFIASSMNPMSLCTIVTVFNPSCANVTDSRPLVCLWRSVTAAFDTPGSSLLEIKVETILCIDGGGFLTTHVRFLYLSSSIPCSRPSVTVTKSSLDCVDVELV